MENTPDMELSESEVQEIKLLSSEMAEQKMRFANAQLEIDAQESRVMEAKQVKAEVAAALRASNQKLFDRVSLALKVRKQDPESPNAKQWNFSLDTMKFSEVEKPAK